MTNANIRPVFGPAPTFGMSDVEKAQLAAEAARVARVEAAQTPPVSPEGLSKPSLANLQAQFLTRHPQVLTFGSTTPTSPTSAHPNYLKEDVVTGCEHLSTEDLWRDLVEGAAKIKDVSDHFAFTPPVIVNALLKAANIQKGERVLEPSAGTGCIALPLALKTENLEAMEAYPKLQELLKRGAMRYDTSAIDPELVEQLRNQQPKFTLLPGKDFLETKPPATEAGKYDKIIMSPPHGGAELDHIAHAYEFLKPGGEMYAILPSYLFKLTNTFLDSGSLTMLDAYGNQRTGTQIKNFRAWFAAHQIQAKGQFIDRNGDVTSKGNSIFGEEFIKYTPGPTGEVIEGRTADLKVVLLKVTKPEVALPLNLNAPAVTNQDGAKAATKPKKVVPLTLPADVKKASNA